MEKTLLESNNKEPIVELLSDDKTKSLLSFSFRGRKTEKSYPPTQQLLDLKEIIDYSKSLNISGSS